MRPRAVVWLVLLALGAARGVDAQAPTGVIAADAVVVNAGMTLTPLRNLQFGSVPLGVATTVGPASPNAGEFQATGSPNAFVSITFTLPATLANTQAVPGVTLPITFPANSARWRRRINNPVGANVFNPNVGATGRFGPPAEPNLYVWIGGRVNPSPTQLPGLYAGTIIITLVYL